jgi:ribokinase
MTVEVCVIGSANLDLVMTAARLPDRGETVLGGSYSEHPGGKGLNQALAAARAGALTSICCCVGGDEAGRRLRRVAGDALLGDEHIHVTSECPTGRAMIAVDETGQNMILVAPGANSALSPEMVVAPARTARVTLAQLEVPVETVAAAFRAALDHDAVTILNPSPAEAATTELLALADYVVLNEHEANALGGTEAIFAAGAGQIVVTLGAEGSLHHRREGEAREIPAPAVVAVDTTGAGDAYCGAFAAALARGRSVEDALRFASAAGALATTAAGAVPSLPDRAAIEKLLAAGVDHSSSPSTATR